MRPAGGGLIRSAPALNGFQKTSMEAVAKAAGISRPGLYLLFPNKEQLYRATMQGVMERGYQAMDACFADETLSVEEWKVAALDALLGQYVETLSASRTRPPALMCGFRLRVRTR
jgi:AcrR family transcriptional regulator